MKRPRRTQAAEAATESQAFNREVDDAVVALLKGGDVMALEQVFDLYGDRVFAVCLGVIGNRDDAEDASQEVFIRAFQQASKFSGRSRFSTWLLRLAANHTLNFVKAAKRRRRLAEPLGEEAMSADPAPETAAISRERGEAIAELLQQISVDQRQVLVLREMEGLCYSELAEVLGVPVGTVTSRLIRARRRLRALILESEFDGLDLG